MTGATGVHLLLWNDDRHDWLLPAPGGAATARSARPLSVLRYVQRTGEPLVVADATRDDRFARDPYFADFDLLLPAGRAHPQPRHAAGGAAAGEPPDPRRVHRRRLDAVNLIAGQLAVSLDNAQLYTDSAASPTSRPRCGGWRRWSRRAPSPTAVFDAVATETQQLLARRLASTLGRYRAGRRDHRGRPTADSRAGDYRSVSASRTRART